jgi:hypothetical protein
MSPSRVAPGLAAMLPAMDIQFDQCEKPRRTLTCADAQRSMRTPETAGCNVGVVTGQTTRNRVRPVGRSAATNVEG